MKAVERLPHPTRDVLVVRALDGDRTFAGFGKARAGVSAFAFIAGDQSCSCGESSAARSSSTSLACKGAVS